MSMIALDPTAHMAKVAWATDVDWNQHREIISRLYWDENKPLKEVTRIMKEEYAFHATERMFKSRLASWGLKKNLKKQDLQKIASEAYLTKKPKLPVIRGRQLGSQRLQQRLQRANAYSKFPFSNGNHALQRIRLGSPGSAGAAEKSIQAILEYTDCRFKTGAWHVSGDYDFNQDSGNDWWVKINGWWTEFSTTATNDIRGSKFTSRAFRLLNELFGEYIQLIHKQHPQTVLATLAGYTMLTRVDPALGNSLLNYVAGLTHIKLGPAHPYTRIWTNLRNTGAAQHTISTLVTAHFDVMVVYAPGNNRFRLASLIQIIGTMNHAHLISFESAYAALSDIANSAPSRAAARRRKKNNNRGEAEREESPPTTTTTLAEEGPDEFWHKLAQRYLCKFLLDSGRFQEAEAEIQAMEPILKENNPDDMIPHLQLKERIMRGLGRWDEALAAMRQGFDVARGDKVLNIEYALEYFACKIKEFHRNRGDDAAAEAFAQEADVHYGELRAQGRIDEGQWRRLTGWRYVAGEGEMAKDYVQMGEEGGGAEEEDDD